ncbi:MAG: WGR domain-containing protein [Myxococcota bacterium]
MARYEYTRGTSNKFWEIEVSGNAYTVQYGRIGTVGQTTTKSFASEAVARKQAESAIRSKEAKGYVKVEEEALAFDRAEAEERLVLADRLQESGDPRGRLIALQHEIGQNTGKDRAALKKTEAALLVEHADALLGPFQTDAGRACSEVGWKLGYWEKLKIFASYHHQEQATEDLLREALGHPSAAQLEHLHLGIPGSVWSGMSNWQGGIDVLAEIGSESVRSLELSDQDDHAEISWCEIGSLAALWPKVPGLEKLVVRGVGIALGAIEAPKLRYLELYSGGLPAEPVRRISEARLPALEHLEILFGAADYGASATIDDCAGILEGRGLPALRWLGLKNAEMQGEIAAAVANAPILARLSVLDLSMGTLVDDQAEVLLAHADRFRHLEKLDLSDNYLSDAMVRRLRDALPCCTAHGQREPDAWNDEVYHYTSVAE